MPELPEVETIRAGVAEHVLGRRISAVRVLRDRAIRHQAGGRSEFEALLVGRTITSAHRRGKFMWLTLADGPDEASRDEAGAQEALLIHLGMSGQLLIKGAPAPTALPAPAAPAASVAPAGSTGPRDHSHLRIVLAVGDRALWFVDQRTFGYMWVTPLVGPRGSTKSAAAAGPLERTGTPAPIGHIAPDLTEPVLAPGTAGYRDLIRRIRGTSRGIKTVLLDQRVISGIGNIYADEALWRARLHYATPADRLRPTRLEELLEAARAVLAEALAAGGTSFDALYVNVAGEPGYFERALAVYGREGAPCPRCGRGIVREPYANRSCYRCPACQRRPPRPAGRIS